MDPAAERRKKRLRRILFRRSAAGPGNPSFDPEGWRPGLHSVAAPRLKSKALRLRAASLPIQLRDQTLYALRERLQLALRNLVAGERPDPFVVGGAESFDNASAAAGELDAGERRSLGSPCRRRRRVVPGGRSCRSCSASSPPGAAPAPRASRAWFPPPAREDGPLLRSDFRLLETGARRRLRRFAS